MNLIPRKSINDLGIVVCLEVFAKFLFIIEQFPFLTFSPKLISSKKYIYCNLLTSFFLCIYNYINVLFDCSKITPKYLIVLKLKFGKSTRHSVLKKFRIILEQLITK